MKITRRQLRQLIRESVEEKRSEAAISHAASQRKDGLSFVDFTGLIVDRLNLYDEWLANKSVDEIVSSLGGNETSQDAENDPCSPDLLPGEDEWDRESRLRHYDC